MGKVIAGATVSLDGFIADESDRVGPLFDWYNNGDVPFNGGDPERVFHVSAASAAYMQETWSRIGAAVIGRRLFEITNGWNGRPAAGDAVFVVTHEPPTHWPFPDAPFTSRRCLARAYGSSARTTVHPHSSATRRSSKASVDSAPREGTAEVSFDEP